MVYGLLLQFLFQQPKYVKDLFNLLMIPFIQLYKFTLVACSDLQMAHELKTLKTSLYPLNP